MTLTVIAGAWAVAWWLASSLIVELPLVRADAIAMLSGSSAFEERAQRAAALYHEGRSKKIILTNDNLRGGWSPQEQRNPYFYERATEELRRSGVPKENIEVLIPPVSGTYEEALLLKTYAKNHGLRSILLVTSSYHSRRAFWTFRQVFGSGETLIGLVQTGSQSPAPTTWWLHTKGWETIPVEYLKLIYYWIRY